MKNRPGKPALDLLEESVHLLRRAPLGVLALYYIGALPFVLALLYFWADMSRGAFAHEHVVQASSTVALLFVWMKCWQAAFCVHLRALAAGAPPARWSARRCLRLALVQAALQPLALFARPLAALITLPYGWVFAFFQNLLVLGDGNSAAVRSLARRAIGQAQLWPRQNHSAQAIITAFGLFVWINVLTGMMTIPGLLKMLFGVESMFTRGSWSITNSTFFAASCAGAYLCVNPLTQVFYTLRCFYGEALQTGEDLRVELRGMLSAVRLTTVAVLFFAASWPLHAAPSSPPAPAVSQQLDTSIDDVLNRREYAWRMPREIPPASQRNWFENFVEGAIKTFRGWMTPLKKWIKKIADWIEDYLRHRQPDENRGGSRTWLKSLRWLFLGLSAVTVGALAFVIWQRWKSGRKTAAGFAQAITLPPDLSAENVTADQLPEDGWMNLAREMTQRGELRLALRAFYLAGLAHLGARELIVLARHKSNRDYETDLRRRARTREDLLASFSDNKNQFERAWYGQHDVTGDTLTRFEANLEKMRAC